MHMLSAVLKVDFLLLLKKHFHSHVKKKMFSFLVNNGLIQSSPFPVLNQSSE